MTEVLLMQVPVWSRDTGRSYLTIKPPSSSSHHELQHSGLWPSGKIRMGSLVFAATWALSLQTEEQIVISHTAAEPHWSSELCRHDEDKNQRRRWAAISSRKAELSSPQYPLSLWFLAHLFQFRHDWILDPPLKPPLRLIHDILILLTFVSPVLVRAGFSLW